LPEGVYDIVVSALAVHHLDGDGKADLFLRIADRLRPGGRFVLADLVIPEDAADRVTPIDDGTHDKPSRVNDQLRWLEAAGLRPRVTWMERDFVVISADRP
jgi:tRNA (cmo5U34)-methyltransferase